MSSERRIGRYVLESKIGHGGTGVVYRARHCDNQRIAAVKVLHGSVTDAVRIQRFRCEAQILATMRHPAIVEVLDSGVFAEHGQPTPYLVTELVEGQPLTDALRHAKPDQIYATFLELCDAIAHAHSRGVLHRDLSPRNVLVDADLRPHVLDFGIARLVAMERRTRTGEVLGTPVYMSPEQARGEVVDERSDVWSLGALLFEVLSSTTPHVIAGMTAAEALSLQQQAAPRRLAAVCPQLPRNLLTTVDRALAAEREMRYPNVPAFAEDLRRCRDGEPLTTKPIAIGAAVRHFLRRRRAAAALVLASAVGITFGLTVGMTAWSSPARAAGTATEALASFEPILSGLTGMAARRANSADEVRAQIASLTPVVGALEPWVEDPRVPLYLARLHETLGDLEYRLENFAKSRQHRNRVVTLLARLGAQASRRDRARALVKLGDLDWLIGSKRVDQCYAAAHYELLQADPTHDLGALDDLGYSYERLGARAHHHGLPAAGQQLLRERIDLVGKVLDSQLTEPEERRACSHYCTAVVAWRRYGGRRDMLDDLALVQRACACADRATELDPTRRDQPVLARVAYTMWGQLLQLQGDLPAAVEKFERACTYSLTEMRFDPGSEALASAVWLRHQLGMCFGTLAEHRAAESSFEAGLPHARQLWNTTRSGYLHRERLWELMLAATRAARARGDHTAEVRWAERVEALFEVAVRLPDFDVHEAAMLSLWFSRDAPTYRRHRGLAQQMAWILERLPVARADVERWSRVSTAVACSLKYSTGRGR